MSRFSRNYITSQFSGSNEDFYNSQQLFTGLEQLHKLWFQINELEKRLSGLASDKRDNLIADFYVLAEKMLSQILSVYSNWSEAHSKEGWWDRWAREHFLNAPTINRRGGIVDIRPFVKQKLEEQYIRSINWFGEFKESEYDHGAVEFLGFILSKIDKSKISGEQENLIRKAITFDDQPLARQMISELGLLRKFYDWSVENGYYAVSYDLEELWGEDWYSEMLEDRGRQGEIEEIVDSAEALDFVWKQWLEIWPGYEQTRHQVNNIIDKLNAIRGTANVNAVMSTLSLALNVAHNTGLMYEHLNLDEDQMDELSNLPTNDWSREIRQYSKKILAMYTNPETFIKDPSAITFSVSAGVVYTAPSFEAHSKLQKDNGLMSVDLTGRISKDRNVCAAWNRGAGENVYDETVVSALNALFNQGLINNETGIFITGSRVNGESYSQFLREYEKQAELGNTGNNFSF